MFATEETKSVAPHSMLRNIFAYLSSSKRNKKI